MNASIDIGALHPAPLAQLGALLVTGPEARTFLQGQLSAEMNELRPGRALLASCNSVQGRVQAVVWLIERRSGIALILPQDLTESIAARLRKYVLRAKVAIESAADRLGVGVVDAAALSGIAPLTEDRAHLEQDGVSLVRLPGHSQVLVLRDPSGRRAPTPDPGGDPDDPVWRLDHIRAGLPQVYRETHETFVAQMLNLDLLDGVSFSKGCYTGQEIIARTHYRGAIKRRMFRFKAPCPAPQPATRVLAGDQHAGEVVDSAPADGGCELLAVISLAQLDQPLELESARGVVLERLPLPYEVMSERLLSE